MSMGADWPSRILFKYWYEKLVIYHESLTFVRIVADKKMIKKNGEEKHELSKYSL
jgi:hypothetical protein